MKMKKTNYVNKNVLTFSSMLTSTDTFANSADPDDRLIRIYTVCHFVIDFWQKPLFATMDVSKFRDSEGKGLIDTPRKVC